ncbi:GNAT family N-acetyltransferase [bacterium]|nr:GNAT family N-acetyltransferase [bacterium]
MHEILCRELKYVEGNDELQAYLKDSPGSDFSGELVDNSDGTKSFTYLSLHVKPEMRRNGIASELVSSLAAAAIHYGANTFEGSVSSEHTLKIFAKLFGEDNIEYYDYDNENNRVYLPMTNEQAISSLERATEFESNLEWRDHYIEVDVNLSDPALSLPTPVFQARTNI